MNNKIKELRYLRGYSLRQLSKMANVSPGYISNLEKNIKDNPTREIMEKIALALGGTVQEVFYDVIEKVG